MTELDDHGLLAEFARSGSEDAFATLAARHVNLVHSAALRFTGNPHHAQEITQAVFIILARKAGGISRKTILSGWLYQTARLTAANFIKAEMRRQRREQEAYMQFPSNDPDNATWQQIAPHLDSAMGDLGEADRNAVVLRFFENKTAQEVGAALQVTEAAAHKRVTRALEKLRKIFSKRGVTLTAALIAGAVSANSVQAAPVGLAMTVTATAAKGTLISATITTLVKGTMNTMAWLKIKFAMGVGAAALLAGGFGTIAISQVSSHSSTAGFQVQGSITRTRGGASPAHFCDFSVVVSGEKSLITVQYFNGESFVCGTDGRDSYLLNEMKPARAKDPNAQEFGYVSAGSFPTKALAPIQLLWLAYASSSALDQRAEHWPLEGAEGDSRSVSNEVRRFAQPPRLPERVNWWAPGVEVTAGQTNYLVQYPDGFLGGSFTAQAPTNFSGNIMPTAWTCTWHVPRSRDSAVSLEIAKWLRASAGPARSSDDVDAGDRMECRVTSIAPLSYQGDFLPKLGTNVSLVDWRFEQEVGGGISIPEKRIRDAGGKVVSDPAFKWTWPQRGDPHLLRLVEAQRQSKPTHDH